MEVKADLELKDHIHLLVDLAPDVSISKLANTMKTVTSREIRKRYEAYLKPYYWKPVFWKRGYCAVSGGGATIDVIKSYIQSQGKDDWHPFGLPPPVSEVGECASQFVQKANGEEIFLNFREKAPLAARPDMYRTYALIKSAKD